MSTGSHAAHIAAMLGGLVNRLDDEKPQLSPATGLVNDVAHLALTASREDASHVRSRIAEILDLLRARQEPASNPASQLDGPDGQVYLDAALWALSAVLEARLDAIDASAAARTDTISGALRALIVEVLTRESAGTPSDMLAQADLAGICAGRDQVSKALGDLLRDGVVTQVAAPTDGDRRNRYFALAERIGQTHSSRDVSATGRVQGTKPASA